MAAAAGDALHVRLAEVHREAILPAGGLVIASRAAFVLLAMIHDSVVIDLRLPMFRCGCGEQLLSMPSRDQVRLEVRSRRQHEHLVGRHSAPQILLGTLDSLHAGRIAIDEHDPGQLSGSRGREHNA